MSGSMFIYQERVNITTRIIATYKMVLSLSYLVPAFCEKMPYSLVTVQPTDFASLSIRLLFEQSSGPYS